MKNIPQNIALITGAAKGIGYAVAKKLAKNNFGIIILDKDKVSLNKAKNNLLKYTEFVISECIDLSYSSGIYKFLKKIEKKNILVNYLINNVGYQEDLDILDLSLEQWQKIFKVNLESAFIFSQDIAKKMIANKKKGCIVNITSLHTKKIRKIAHYSVSKAALNMLTKELAIRLASHKIRVNAIAPGAIDTPMNFKYLRTKTLRKKADKSIPLKRLGTPDDIANAVEFLISDKAEYITGTTVTVDGGLSLII